MSGIQELASTNADDVLAMLSRMIEASSPTTGATGRAVRAHRAHRKEDTTDLVSALLDRRPAPPSMPPGCAIRPWRDGPARRVRGPAVGTHRGPPGRSGGRPQARFRPAQRRPRATSTGGRLACSGCAAEPEFRDRRNFDDDDITCAAASSWPGRPPGPGTNRSGSVLVGADGRVGSRTTTGPPAGTRHPEFEIAAGRPRTSAPTARRATVYLRGALRHVRCRPACEVGLGLSSSRPTRRAYADWMAEIGAAPSRWPRCRSARWPRA